MNHFQHTRVIDADPAAVYAAITTAEGLRAWWTPTCDADAHVGGAAHFRFGETFCAMSIEQLDPNRGVRWFCTAARIEHPRVTRKDEWAGTEIAFRLTPTIDAGFRRLARERFAAHPLRALVTLPARRLLRLWWAPPAREIHWIKIPLLGLPGTYPMIVVAIVLLYGLAPLGLLSPHRGLVAVCVALLAARSLLHAFAVPHQVGYRYWLEAWPIVGVLAALGVLALARRTRRG